MDSTSGSESRETSKLMSCDGGGILLRNVDIEITSVSRSSESQKGNYDGCRRDRDSSVRLEMDLFAKSQYSATTSSYSSSDKYSEDFFRVIPTDMTKPDKDILVLHENSDAATVTTSSSSTEPASIVSDVTHESMMDGMSPARSPPPLQMMDRSGGYQPGRIPSSVFERSPGLTPVEWSIASNESLFSIHIGSISFSRDQFLMLSGDMQKSGELPQFDEATSISQQLEYDDACVGPIVEHERNFKENENAARMSFSRNLKEENGRAIFKETRDDPFVTQMTPSLNDEQHARSSTIPIKKKKKKSTCSCSCPKLGFRWLRTICGWSPACCRCGWPSCHFRCPILDCKCRAPSCDCSCLTCWSSCCDWNCCSKGSYSCCFPSKKPDTEWKSRSSCWSCHCGDSCCTCTSCRTLSFSCNLCYSSCFGCHRKCRCCC